MGDSVLELAIRDGHQLSGKTLSELETVIERGQQTFIEVGRALLEIRDGRLYRDTYTTFEAYCRERWGWTRQHANRQIAAARVVEEMEPTGSIPENEWQARAIRDAQRREDAEDAQDALAALEEADREGTIGLSEFREELGIPDQREAQQRPAPPPQPRRDTTSDRYMVELVRDKLTRLRDEYGTLAFWRPVWDAIDAVNKEPRP